MRRVSTPAAPLAASLLLACGPGAGPGPTVPLTAPPNQHAQVLVRAVAPDGRLLAFADLLIMPRRRVDVINPTYYPEPPAPAGAGSRAQLIRRSVAVVGGVPNVPDAVSAVVRLRAVGAETDSVVAVLRFGPLAAPAPTTAVDVPVRAP